MKCMEDSRDYDVKKLKELDDPRFSITFREAVFSETFFFGTILAEIAAAYLLCPEDMREMTYILGFPAWFFAAVIIALISWGFVLFHNAKISRDFSLEARSSEEDAEDVSRS